MVAPWLLQMIPTILGYAGKQGFFGDTGGTQQVSQKPMQTPEQKAAMAELMKIGTGGLDMYGGKLGAYEQTELEKAGGSKLMGMVGAGLPKMLGLGQAEIEKLLTTEKYDPYAKGGVYGGMKRNILREQQEQQDILAREGARTGGLSSTWMGKETGLLGERTTGKLSDVLASLYQRFGEQKLAGAKTAAEMGLAEEQVGMGRAGAAFQYGALPRMLETARAQDKYSEWQRAKGVKLDALTKVAGANIPYGVTDVPVYKKNPWSDLLNMAIMQFGQTMGSGGFSKS